MLFLQVVCRYSDTELCTHIGKLSLFMYIIASILFFGLFLDSFHTLRGVAIVGKYYWLAQPITIPVTCFNLVSYVFYSREFFIISV
jgi:hypothetical protein